MTLTATMYRLTIFLRKVSYSFMNKEFTENSYMFYFSEVHVLAATVFLTKTF